MTSWTLNLKSLHFEFQQSPVRPPHLDEDLYIVYNHDGPCFFLLIDAKFEKQLSMSPVGYRPGQKIPAVNLEFALDRCNAILQKHSYFLHNIRWGCWQKRLMYQRGEIIGGEKKDIAGWIVTCSRTLESTVYLDEVDQHTPAGHPYPAVTVDLTWACPYIGNFTMMVERGRANERTITFHFPIDRFPDLAKFGIHLGVKCPPPWEEVERVVEVERVEVEEVEDVEFTATDIEEGYIAA
ncbi:hypothetical protein ACJ72_06569 [Emergomyces africanus]|uniref:Uncharacterized protein n=1 Tax=Emergomyces africanus TaxID=1955775 RepID=A0A1B7NR02_9EURO|nr:hypothetical protein ACJ72_06569 [Emergomyces africanus]